MKKNYMFLLLGALIVTLSGCATLFTGTRDYITFKSNPPGATIKIDGLAVGKTPATISVKRPGLSEKRVTLELEGYEPVTFILQTEFNTVSILNLNNLIGWGIDLATGAIKKYSLLEYNIKLKKATKGGSSIYMSDLPRDNAGRYIVTAPKGKSTLILDRERGIAISFEQSQNSSE